MMRGQLYVDGNDVYADYGIYVVAGGWCELVAMPPLKDVDSNDWHEMDGEEADLSNPVLDTRNVTINFAVANGGDDAFIEFIDLLSDGAYHEFNCACFNRTYTLRLVSQPNMDYAKILGLFSLKFADDFPLPNYTYQAPQTTFPTFEDYLLDNAPFTDYGVRILDGTLSSVMTYPEVKENMLRNINSVEGVIYDPLNVTFKSKDVKLYCLMRASTIDELWRNYDALLYDLTKPDEREITVDALDQDFPCYYKQCSVSEFNFDGKIWMKFTLTMHFTRDVRLNGTQYVLATEDDIVVHTEDDIYAVDMVNAQLAEA